MKLVLATFALLASACIGALPPAPASSALHRDLQRLVEIQGTEGWSMDRFEIQEALPSALDSLCRTTPQTRTDLLEWLDTQITASGGSPAEAYLAAGKDLGAISEILALSRIRLLLKSSLDNADTDCPFWLEPKQNFRGRQILDDRWFLHLGGGGKGMVVHQGGVTDLNGGGAGRFLLGRGIGQQHSLLTGLEFGGSAAFPKNEDGSRGELSIGVDVVVPLVYRRRLVNSYWEVEAGYVGHLTEGEVSPANGLHLGIAVGGASSRRRWFIPGAAFGVGYEYIVDNKAGGEILHVVKMGFRVAIDVAN